MEKSKWAIWGPLGEEGVSPIGLGGKGGAYPPIAGAPPPLGSLVPHGGGEEDGTPLAYIRRGRPTFFHHQLLSSVSLFLLPRADSPCLDFAPGWEFSTICTPSLC